MYRLLVPVDDNDERADKQVQTIESLPEMSEDIEAHVLYIYEEIDTAADEGGSVYIDEINESLDELRDPPETVDRVRAALDERGFNPEVHELIGDPADTILEMATTLDADTILMSVRDRSPIGKVVFGSVSQKVILGSEIPVIVAR